MDGVVAVGGDLSPERLILAYSHGIFPWYNEDEPILWWSPDPRMVLIPGEIKVHKSMRRYFNRPIFELTANKNFREVINACSAVPRQGQSGTWIHEEMIRAYTSLHELGYAHSFEVWQNGQLAGGLYGVVIGKLFFGESMFAHTSDASKFALISLAEYLESKDFLAIDCQQDTHHLRRMGARLISGEAFEEMVCKNRELHGAEAQPDLFADLHA